MIVRDEPTFSAGCVTVHIFVYEFVTGGGFVDSGRPLPSSLLAEGRTMVGALVEDLSRIEGCTISTMRDWRLDDFVLPAQTHYLRRSKDDRATFCRLAATADWTIVIAPEFDNHLHLRTSWVESVGGRLLGPSSELVRLAANKRKLAERLATSGVSVPVSRRIESGDQLPTDFFYPAILKPVDGAGSIDVRLIMSAHDPISSGDGERRLERLCPGMSVSVSFLCGPTGYRALAPCRQGLSEDGRFSYQGGTLPLDRELAVRAQSLAARAIDTLENPLGYLGVDLVLGEDASGKEDVVIEINPRLTTSYVGLRMAASGNLAAAMLGVASGQQVSLSFAHQPLQFDATGAVHAVTCP